MLTRLNRLIKPFGNVLLICFSLATINIFAQQVLKPQDAFPVEVAYQNNVIQISHQIKDGYYLYKDKISYSSLDSRIQLGTTTLPEGIKYEDEFFGKTEIFRNSFTIYIPISISTGETVNAFDIQINSQGCADIGLCYPPQKWRRTAIADSLTEIAVNTADIEISDQVRLGNIISDANIFLVSLMFLGLGFALAFTPCHLPTIPILSSIIIGQSNNNKLKSLGLSMSYVLGMAITYCIAGVAAALAGQQMQALFTLPVFIISMSILFIVLGLGMLGLFNVQLPSNVMNRVNTVLSNQVGGSYIGVVIIGSLSALLVTACVAPPLVATLMVIGESGNIFRGIVALSSLSLGLGIPLIIIGLSASKWLPKSGDYLETIKNVFGFVMFALAIWIMNPIISESLLSKLWILLVFSTIFYFLGRFRGNIMGFPMCRVLRASLVILFFGLYFYSPSYLGIDQSNTPDKLSAQYFDSVESINDLNKLINTATAKDQASLIYFTADWCISCRTLEKNTFNNNQLLNDLEQINALKVDVTDNNDDDKQLMKAFNIFGPPTIIMISPDGNEISPLRKIGVVTSEELIEGIEQLTK